VRSLADGAVHGTCTRVDRSLKRERLSRTVAMGGYKNAAVLPSAKLLEEIEYVDTAIGIIVSGLQSAGIYDNTLLIITAKHGDSPTDPTRYVADGTITPTTILATNNMIPCSESPLNPTGIGATEDEVSVLWLKKGASVNAAVRLLESNAAPIGMGEIFYGPSVALNYKVGGTGASRGFPDARHHRSSERGRDVLEQHFDDRRSRRLRA
jgi:hypothetical protein